MHTYQKPTEGLCNVLWGAFLGRARGVHTRRQHPQKFQEINEREGLRAQGFSFGRTHRSALAFGLLHLWASGQGSHTPDRANRNATFLKSGAVVCRVCFGGRRRIFHRVCMVHAATRRRLAVQSH